jgi:hypothetical protein
VPTVGRIVGSTNGQSLQVGWDKIVLALLAPGVIAGIITAAVPALPFVGAETAASRAEREAKADSIQLSRLRDALRLEDPDARAQTVRILIDIGLLEDPAGALRARAAFPDSIPQWP